MILPNLDESWQTALPGVRVTHACYIDNNIYAANLVNLFEEKNSSPYDPTRYATKDFDKNIFL